jgi:hypothetical protein
VRDAGRGGTHPASVHVTGTSSTAFGAAQVFAQERKHCCIEGFVERLSSIPLGEREAFPNGWVF